MKLTRRVLALILALLMLPIWNPVEADAAEVIKPVTENSGSLIGNVNPLYQGLVDADDFTMPEFPDHSGSDAEPMATYVSVSEAAKQLRKYMKNRTESFTIYVKSESWDVSEVAETLLTKAMAHTGDPEEGDYLMWQWGRWDAYYDQYYDESYNKYKLDFSFSYYTTAAQEKKVDTAVNNLISSLGISGKSDYKKIKAVYDWICDNVTYDEENLNNESYTRKFSAYAALIDKTAVCQGYALLFYRMMLELDIDARLIAGISGEPHAWNIVELNGVYYNMDSTWDAGYDEHLYFLNNSWDFLGHYRYLDYETWEFHEEYPMAKDSYVSGAEAEVDPFIYIGACSDTVAFGVERDGTLTIAGEGVTRNYSYGGYDSSGAPWKFWGEHLKKVVVEEGITELGKYFFHDLQNLKTVSLPNSLVKIGDGAFCSCVALTSVTIPEGVTTIGREAFYNCSSLTKVEFPNTLTTIGIDAFYGCSKLKNVTFPSSVTTIEWNAFAACTSLTSVVIPETVTYLGGHCFQSCTGLEKVEINCEEIGREIFAGCQKLSEVKLGDNVRVIGTSAFRAMDALTSITIPAGVEQIGMRAFWYSDNLREVYFMGDAPEFDGNAFYENTLTAYYPKDNPTWTEDVLQNYGGTVTWVAAAAKTKAPDIKASNVASTGKIKVSWDAVDGAVEYRVYRSTDKKSWKKLITTKATSIINSSAKAGELYYYYAVAVNEDGIVSDKSDIISRRCDLPCPEVTVSNIASTGKLKISWDAITDATGYQVYYSTDGVSFKLLKTLTGTSLKHTSAKAGTTYYYKVRATASESSANSAYSEVVTGCCILPRPTVTLGNDASTGVVQVRWEAVEGAVGYEVHRSPDKENWELLATVVGTSLTDSSSENGVLYYYKVKALAADPVENSAFSSAKSRRADLPQPDITVSTIESTGKIMVSWEKIDGAVGYEVYSSTDNKEFTLLKTVTGTSLKHTSAKAGTTYYYKVRAIASESSANSAYSDVKSRVCALAQPTLTVSNVASSGKVKLSWKSVSGATGYEVYYSTDNVNFTLLKTATGTSLNHTSAVYGTTYYYKIRAVGSESGMASAYSATASGFCCLARPTISKLTIVTATGKIRATWKAVEGAVGYEVYYSTDSESWTLLTTTTDTTVVHESGVAGTRYYYKVKALAADPAENSADSAVKNGYCDLARPTLEVTLNSKNKPYLTWSKIEGAVSYEVYRSTDGENWTLLKTTTGTKLTHSSAVSGTTYYYKVRAIASVSNANSAYSTVKSITAG